MWRATRLVLLRCLILDDGSELAPLSQQPGQIVRKRSAQAALRHVAERLGQFCLRLGEPIGCRGNVATQQRLLRVTRFAANHRVRSDRQDRAIHRGSHMADLLCQLRCRDERRNAMLRLLHRDQLIGVI